MHDQQRHLSFEFDWREMKHTERPVACRTRVAFISHFRQKRCVKNPSYFEFTCLRLFDNATVAIPMYISNGAGNNRESLQHIYTAESRLLLLLFVIMISRREEIKAAIKNRRRSKRQSSVGRIAVGEVDRPKDKEFDAGCKPNNVSSSIPLDSTVSTASVTMSFDTSFNSGNTEINSPVMASPAAPIGCNTPTVKKRVRFGGSSDGGAHSPIGDNMLNKNQILPKMPAESFEWTSSLTPEIGLTPIKDDQIRVDDFYPFGEDSDDEFAALEYPVVKIQFDEDEVGALSSPVGVNDMTSISRERLNGTKTSQSSPAKTSSVKQDMLLKLREENERLKNELKEASEEAGTLDAAGALVDERSHVDTADESTLFLENSILDTSFYENNADTGIVNEDIDEGASYNSRSQGDWVDVTLDSDLGSVSMGSSINNTHNVLDPGPSSSTLRKALRHQRRTDSFTSTCPSVFEELKGTCEDASNAFNQVLNAFFVSLDDVDKTAEAMSGVKKDLRVSHTDKFVPRG